MNPRLDYYSASPKAMKAMIAMEALTSSLSIEPALLHLVKIRASQLNGCAFCTDMHSVDARRLGETDRRLYSIVVWRDSNFFNPRERAALAWTEALTHLGPQGVPQDVYDAVHRELTEKEMSDLGFLIITINGWNRMCVAFQTTPGSCDAAFGLDKAGLH